MICDESLLVEKKKLIRPIREALPDGSVKLAEVRYRKGTGQ